MTNLQYQKIFKALSDEMRLHLLQRISSSDEICVCKLMEEFAMAQSKLSYHLKLLLEAELISVPAASGTFILPTKLCCSSFSLKIL